MRLDARSLDARAFTGAQLDALWAAIQVNDVVADADPPAVPPTLDYRPEQLIDGFAISRRLWREGFDRPALIALTRALARGATLDEEERLRFKHVRAKFKHLRFAFVLYGADHRCPTMFKAVTTAMGHLQDAFKGGHATATRRYATLLRHLLGGLPDAMVRREVDRLDASDPDDYRRFVVKQMATLSAMLDQPAMTGHQFHAARKIVSRQVSFHDDMRAITDDPEHPAMARFLSAINGLMGRAHDDLVLGRASGEVNYARAELALPDDLRRRLQALVDLYPPRLGASSSAPPSR